MSDRKIIFALLCLGSFAISFNIAAIAAVIPTISRDLAIKDTVAAQLIPYYMIPYGLSALIYAPLTTRFSFRAALGSAMACFGLASFYCASSEFIGQLLIGRLVMGVTAAAIIPLGLILIGRLFEKNVRGRMVGTFFSSTFIASIAGIAVSASEHWRLLFYVPAALGAINAVLAFVVPSEILKQNHGLKVDYFKVFRLLSMAKVLGFIFVISLLFHGVSQWMGVYLSRVYHLEQIKISSIFMAMTVSAAAGQMLGGVLSDFKGRLFACLTGIILLASATMMLGSIYPVVFLVLILCVLQVGWTVGHNGVSTVLTDFPDENRPELAALNSSIRFLSGGLGFSLAGLFVEKSFGLTFLGIGVMMLALSVFLRDIIPGYSK